MADGKVVIDTSLNNRGFVKGVKTMNAEMTGLGKTVKKLSGLIVAAFSVRAIVNFSKECIELGSAIAEVQNVVDVAFGAMSFKIEQFAEAAIENFGMSKLSAKRTASTYMAMAKGMGIADDAASDMAISLTGLTGDVSSFFNISQELADTKLKSVFTGETETLKDLGVVMTQANLKAYALEKGINKDISAMSQAELVALRYEFVMDQLAIAHGDFARTADSWANQTRILSEQWKEFMSIVGDTLILVLKPLVKTLNEIVAGMIKIAESIRSVMLDLFGGTVQESAKAEENTEGMAGAIQDGKDAQDGLTDSIKETEDEQKKSMALFDDVNKLVGEQDDGKKREDAETPLLPDESDGEKTEAVIDGMAQKIEALLQRVKGFLDVVRSEIAGIIVAVKSIWKAFADAWKVNGLGVLEAAKNALNNIWALIKSIGEAFIEVWTNGTGVRILTTINSIIANILNTVSALAERFRIAWEANGNGVAIWQSILDIVQLVLDFIERITAATLAWAETLDFEPLLSAVRGFLKAIEPLIGTILDGLYWIYENIVLPVAKWFIEQLLPEILNMFSAVADLLNEILILTEPLQGWIWENVVKPLGEFAADTVIRNIQVITELIRALADLLRGDFAGAIGHVGEAFRTTIEQWKELFRSIGNLCIGIAQVICNVFWSAINGIIDILNSIDIDIPDWVPLIGGSSIDFNIPKMEMPTLPRLATGAVIPANREFLAVLGDQKSGTNIEAPMSTIEEGVENVLRRNGWNGGGAREIRLIVSAKSGIGKALKFEVDKETERQGVKLVGG